MSDIYRSRAALRDYRNPVDWLEERNPAAASRVAEAIARRVARLEAMPRIGRVGRVAGTRELVIVGTPYLYRIDSDEKSIGIVRLLHSVQRWPPRGS